MLLQDLAIPDSGRLLQVGPGGISTISDDSESTSSPSQIGIYLAGAGLILLCAFWCISSVRSGLAPPRDVNTAAAPGGLPRPHDDERADDEIQLARHTARKYAILEVFRTSEVTMVRKSMCEGDGGGCGVS
jgi:hypothetical protein